MFPDLEWEGVVFSFLIKKNKKQKTKQKKNTKRKLVFVALKFDRNSKG